MRINLSVPFSENKEAKALGAWWDQARKTWYLVNVEDLTPFMRWVPKARPVRSKKDARLFGVTGSKVVGGCGCDVLPWVDCEHTMKKGLIDGRTT